MVSLPSSCLMLLLSPLFLKKNPEKQNKKPKNTHTKQTKPNTLLPLKKTPNETNQKNTTHSKRKAASSNILNIPSATFVCCKRVMVYAWPLWVLGKKVWAEDWIVAVKINLFNLSVNHICPLRTPRTSEMLFVILTVLRKNCFIFLFMIKPWIQTSPSFLANLLLQNELVIVAKKSWIYNMVCFYVFANLTENTINMLAASHCFNELHFGNTSLCGGRKKIWKGIQNFFCSEHRIAYFCTYIYASGWRWLKRLCLARFSMWFRNCK